MVMLEVVHVTKRYRRVLANDDINLTIEDGRIGVLLGPNGAGKSTTMNMITGYIASTEGKVMIDGHDGGSQEMHRLSAGNAATLF